MPTSPSSTPASTVDGHADQLKLSAAERKRSRVVSTAPTACEAPVHRTRSKPSTTSDAAMMSIVDGAALPPSTALMTSAMKRELSALMSSASEECDSHTVGTPVKTKKTKITATEEESLAHFPTHKVGALEMYHRFPDAYELFMRRHDCRALERFLVHEVVVPRIVTSATSAHDSREEHGDKASGAASHAKTPFLRVADFGCGTGRIERMLVPHTAVKAIYAYDLEVPMLKHCLVNVAGACRTHRLRPERGGLNPHGTVDGVRLLPTASDVTGPVIFPPANATAETQTTSDAPSSSVSTIDLCLRACPFQLIQAGFLRGHAAEPAFAPHPRCHMVVCAWSLSFVMRMQWGEDSWHNAIDTVVTEMLALLDNSTSDAALVIIETLGNLAPTPTRQNKLMQRLEDVHGFTQDWVRTDYRFRDVEEAVKMTHFFFGSKMSSHMAEAQLSVLMECTGIWVKWKPKQGVAK